MSSIEPASASPGGPAPPRSGAYLVGAPQLTAAELAACELVSPENEAELDRRLAEICREIRERRTATWAWEDGRRCPFAPLTPELAEAVVDHFRAGVPARTAARDLTISVKTIRKWYRRCRADGIRQESGVREVIRLEGFSDAA